MRLLLLSFFGMTLSVSFAQLVTSNGAILQIQSGATVQVNGGVELKNNSACVNNGTWIITKNSTFTLPGNLHLLSNSTVSGNGRYEIEQDWLNNATFTAGTSTVEFFGNTQQFIGTTTGTITTFNNLELTGTGTGTNRKKTLQGANAGCGTTGNLSINDRELETQTFTFFVNNTALTAVTNTTTPGSEGFVSSTAPGTFTRNTNAIGSYLFPTGSSAGTLRYRPIILAPTQNTTNTFSTRLNNFDASTDGHDRNTNDNSFCTANPLYYHSIERTTGASPADITLHYISAADGAWTGIAQWQLGNTQWNNVANATGGTSGIFNTQVRNAWLFTNPGDPYILTNVRPDVPVLNCPEVCENSTGNIFSATGTGTTYNWTFPANGTITGGQGTDQATVDWTTGTGTVSVVAVDASGCQSDPATCTPTVNPLPNVQFTYANAGTSAEFTDQTSNAIDWDWSFGDGNNAQIENPTHEYPALGEYSVSLTVTDNNGCVNSATQLIELLDQIVIPNIITPNGDGINDLFEITTGGITDYNLIIQNRWGEVVYTTTDPLKHWDGKSDGTMVSEGVYFYQLTLTNIKETLKFHGFVTVSH